MATSHSHSIHGDLLSTRVRVTVAGAGGNGAQVIGMLARLDLAIRALGHPHGLHVTAYDPDTVSEANVGRQIWSRPITPLRCGSEGLARSRNWSACGTRPHC